MSRPELPRELPARRGYSVSYLGKTLLSRVDPVTQAERLAADIPVREGTLYFCPSPLYGYGLSLFLGRLSGELSHKKSAVLCVEADEYLFEISRKAFTEIKANAGLALTRISGAAEACAFVRKTWGTRSFRRVETIRLTGGWQLFSELYDETETALRREMAQEWGNAMTLIKLGRLYAQNLIRNLAFLPEGENLANLSFGAAPVLVLGAGPSLDSTLDEISSFASQRRFKIVCVDSCLPALHARGISPDLVVILESQHWNLRCFRGERGRIIDAAIDLSALPASSRVLGGKRFFFATPWTKLALFKRLEEAGLLPEKLPPLGSVGLSAVALALKITSGPVITGGIDFSFTLDSYHARSTPGYTDKLLRQNRFKTLLNAGAAFQYGTFSALSKNENSVRSDPSMRNYRDLFEAEFGGNSRLMDIAGNGLPLGLKTLSPAKAFAVLNRNAEDMPVRCGATKIADKREKAAAFVREEIAFLNLLKETLTGITAEKDSLEELIDNCDYLWAHFPDCAGAARPPVTDLSFLKRVRIEIDPFLKLWEMTLKETKNSNT